MNIRHWNRRDVLRLSGAAAAAWCCTGVGRASEGSSLKRALIGKPTKEYLERLKAAGFDGMESEWRNWKPSAADAAAAKAAADSLGLRIHSVLFGWANFNKAESFESDIRDVTAALNDAAVLGADALLLVPCRIGGMKMPEAWDFDIEFDEKTGHLTRVVKGDNSPYADYIAAHNKSVDDSRRAVELLIPAAEKAGVVIALENVWNNLWVKPAVFAHFVRMFKSRWVKAYFDIGNHVKYALPQEWLRALGAEIVKLHVKDFKLNDDGKGGKFVNIRDGSVDWPLVRREIDAIGYKGWLTIEGGDLSMEEHRRRLDAIIAGQ